jgi:DNA (cytosine-5)-methyltransferase 1
VSAQEPLRVLDLFSGIGGFSLGLERTGGFRTVAFCEIEPFPRRVLRKHWPEVPIYEDVRAITADIIRHDGIAVDVITGGFPCQDLSIAGKRAGLDGARSGLWSEIVRLICELRPRYVIVENVANLLSGPSEKRGGWFGRVLGDLAECGYDAEWENIPAAALGAPHRRERIWICAYTNEIADGEQHPHAGEWRNGARQIFDVADAAGERHARQRLFEIAFDCATRGGWEATEPEHGGVGSIWRTEPDVGRVAHGVPARVDRLAGLGNAVVPQIPELIGRAILQAEGRV